jgi:hypothetical protein
MKRVIGIDQRLGRFSTSARSACSAACLYPRVVLLSSGDQTISSIHRECPGDYNPHASLLIPARGDTTGLLAPRRQ